MATSIKKIMGIERNSIRKLNKLQLSEELFCNSLFGDANLVSYWRLEGNANDSKGSNNGTGTNITYNASYGKFGQGALFNGSTGLIDFGAGASLNITSAITFGGWIKPTMADMVVDGFRIGGKISLAPSTNGYLLLITNAGLLQFGIRNGGTAKQATSTAALTDAWTFIVGRYNGSVVDCFINDTKYTGDSVSGGLGSSTDSFKLGQYVPGSVVGRFKGSMDDVFIFNRALSDTEISNLYNTNIKKFMGVSNV